MTMNEGPNSPIPRSQHDEPQHAGPWRGATERQLSALFGDSLFGPWPELDVDPARAGALRSRHVWLRRLAALAFVVAVVAGFRLLTAPVLARKTNEDRAHYAEQLAMFLEDGNLERTSEFLELVRGGRGELERAGPHLDQVLRAEAAVYRYHDASPRRLALLESVLALEGVAQRPAARVARMTLLSRAERAKELATLEGLAKAVERDPEIPYLMATALEVTGDIEGARRAWSRSQDYGPSWLAHRFEQGAFEVRQGNEAAAKDIAAEIARLAPASPWTAASVEVFGIEAPLLEAGVAEPSLSPVHSYQWNLAKSVRLLAADEGGLAREAMVQAVAAVNGQEPFVLDAFDSLLQAQAVELARALTMLPEWPKGSRTGISKEEQLAKLLREP